MSDNTGRVFPVDIPRRGRALFAQDAANVTIQRVLLDNARDVSQLSVGAGTFIWAYRASDLGAELTVHFNNQRNEGVVFNKGMSIDSIAFSNLYVTNTAQAGKWIEFLIVRGDGESGLVVTNASSAFQEVRIDVGDTVTTSADINLPTVAVTALAAANTARRQIHIQAHPSNAREIRVGDAANVGAARGLWLNPGEHLHIESTAALSAYNPHIAAQTAMILSEDE